MSAKIRFGKYSFDPRTKVLYSGTEVLDVPLRSGAILARLLEEPGEVVSKDALIEAGWPDSHVGEAALTEAVSKLRKGLNENSKDAVFIATVHGRGYRFTAPIEPPGPSVDPGGRGEPTDDPPNPLPPPPPPRRWAQAIAILAVVLGPLALWALLPESTPPASSRLERLGLRVPGDHLDHDALADFLERETALVVAAADGGSDPVLEVEVQEVDGWLDISARVDAVDGTNLWGQDWRMPAALFDEDRFARSLLSRLRFLLDLRSAYSAVTGSDNPEAVLLATRASDLLLGAAQHDLTRAEEAAGLLRRAVDLDPNFARAQAGRHAARAEAVEWRPWTPAEFEVASADVASAVARDPDDPVVQVGRALVARIEGDTDAALAALDAAEGTGSPLFWIYMVRAEFEHQLGFDDLALATTNRGLELDPYLPALWGRLIDVRLWRGELDAAAEALATLEQLDVDGYWSGRSRFRILAARGDTEAAEIELQALVDRWANALWVHKEAEAFYSAQGNAAAAEAAAARAEALLRE